MPGNVMVFSCPYLKGEVELTLEREQHIAENHPDLLPAHHSGISETLADPDEIRRSLQVSSALLFSKRYDQVLDGKNVVVVVMTGTAMRVTVIGYSRRISPESSSQEKPNGRKANPSV